MRKNGFLDGEWRKSFSIFFGKTIDISKNREYTLFKNFSDRVFFVEEKS